MGRKGGSKFISTSCFVFSYLRVFVIDFGMGVEIKNNVKKKLPVLGYWGK